MLGMGGTIKGQKQKRNQLKVTDYTSKEGCIIDKASIALKKCSCVWKCVCDSNLLARAVRVIVRCT